MTQDLSEQAETVVVQQLREIRALRDEVASLRSELNAVETKIDGLAAMMAAVAGQAAKGGRP